MLGTERRGCFEPPSDTNKPNSNIDCLDIVPIESEFNVTNIENMKVDNQLVHPDSANINRYIMGTRLQTRGAKGKVKRGEQADVEKTKEITEQPEGKSVKEEKRQTLKSRQRGHISYQLVSFTTLISATKVLHSRLCLKVIASLG